MVDGRIVGVVVLVHSGEQTVLQVGHDPRAVARTVAPDLDVAEVDGLHGAVAVVVAVRLGVAVVEAAAAVVVRAVEDRVHALGVVPGGDAVGVVVAVAGAGRHEDAVGLVTSHRGGRGGRVGEVVGAARGTAAGCLGEVVAAARLVVDDRDQAGRARAERVLGGGVGVPARLQDTDVPGRVVRGAPNLVERSVVRGIQRPRRAVRRHAGGVAGRVDVARTGRGGPGRTGCGRRTGQGSADERGRGRRPGERLPTRAC